MIEPEIWPLFVQHGFTSHRHPAVGRLGGWGYSVVVFAGGFDDPSAATVVKARRFQARVEDRAAGGICSTRIAWGGGP